MDYPFSRKGNDQEKSDRVSYPEMTDLQEIEMELEHWKENYPGSSERIKALEIELAEEELKLSKERQETSELHIAMECVLIDDVPW